MEGPKEFVARLRREKFGVGVEGVSPLAPELHQAIQQLSVELYQNDFHFIKEIIQNAEDNTYGEDVCPSLEFQLVKEDLAKVGCSATLLILNNELGLNTADVKSLCSVGRSTKAGKRNEGYIGCKGIGFKSVFMICETPMIFSNGYRIGFRDSASKDVGVGYIVPEWIESPSDEEILAACGGEKLPTTVILLPIRASKVDLVRNQLKELSPEIILFLKRIRELTVVEKTGDAVEDLLRITRSKPISGITSSVCKFFEVTLRVEKSATTVSDSHSYLIFQRSYPVTHPVEERKEISKWAVTLAFAREGRAPSGHIGDVFSFLPTELRTGFPFIINADFILTSSRETIRFDSQWNIGILGCIPGAYRIAFLIMLGRSKPLWLDGISLNSKIALDFRDAYRHLPTNTVENAYKFSSPGSMEHRQVRQKIHIQPHLAANIAELEEIRVRILKMLETEHVVLLSRSAMGVEGSSWSTPQSCLQIKPSFRRILESAAQCNCPAPSVLLECRDGVKFDLVDGYIQKHYPSGLSALGVREMTASQYKSFVTDSKWLLQLPEDVYFQVLSFVAFEIKLHKAVAKFTFALHFSVLKVQGDKGKVELAPFYEFSSKRGQRSTELFYINPAEDAEWISKWVTRFNEWLPAKVMPAETSRALLKASDSYQLMMWIKELGSLTELTVHKYSEKLIRKLTVCHEEKLQMVASQPQSGSRPFPVLVLQFLYNAICKKLLRWEEVVLSLQSLGPVTVLDDMSSQECRANSKLREEGQILLPPKVSMWPLLFSFTPGYASNLIVLSDKYLHPQCSFVKEIVTKSPGPRSMLEFLQQVFNAVDLPLIELPANKPFPLLHPVTMQKSMLLLQWLKGFLPNRRTTKMEQEKDCLLTSLKTMEWMKTVHHGWQRPTSVFFSPSYNDYNFTPKDLPCLDVGAYSPIDLTDFEARLVFEELEVVTNMDKEAGGAVVAEYFSKRPAEELDQETVRRFYAYLYVSDWNRDNHSVKVWTPPNGASSVPMWRSPTECVLRDEADIFSATDFVIVLDKLYEGGLLPFFSETLHVPDRASVDSFCKVWLKWCSDHRNRVEQNDNQMERQFCISHAKVQCVWNCITQNRSKISKEVWESFLFQAWVPVDPSCNDSKSETVYIMPPRQVFIADDLALSMSFCRVLSGKLHFVWLLPGISARQSETLVKLYSLMGVRTLSEAVKCDVDIPPNVGKEEIAYGEGLICEGLFRSVLAYLCHLDGEKHSLSVKRRQQILSPLISAIEVVVNEPFPRSHSLPLASLTSPAIVTKNVFSHYDKGKGILFYLRRDHALLQGDVGRRVFHAHFSAVVSTGILSEYPELVQGLTTLLKLLCDSSFALKSVEYELQVQNLFIFPEDENLLIQSMATRRSARVRG